MGVHNATGVADLSPVKMTREGVPIQVWQCNAMKAPELRLPAAHLKAFRKKKQRKRAGKTAAQRPFWSHLAICMFSIGRRAGKTVTQGPLLG